ncbi:adenylate/guanylate cyclase domain-containing protein [Melittangium boletus]|uniref:adenylate/guanylate cyclase domain-containing protein n=1 Tax=Melittangium boletus TaxID=83453 RepID=UPI0015D19745|nr:adenylate/guanylate cyclase domain-containing protein [Melittangium boletus]
MVAEAMQQESMRVSAIMFTDMVELSTQVRRDSALDNELREEQRRLVRELLSDHGGREIKRLEDGFLVEFDGALPAVACALELQSALCARNECVPDERRVQLRIGIHLGSVVHQDGDVFGEGVNLAARLESLAPPGSLYVSEPVARQVRDQGLGGMVRLGRGELKNIRLPVPVYRIDPPGSRSRSWMARLRELLPIRARG